MKEILIVLLKKNLLLKRRNFQVGINKICMQKVSKMRSLLEGLDEMVKETKMEQIDNVSIKALWGNFSFDFTASPSIVLNAGLFKGISLNDSLMLSYLFYADDGVFVGEWDDTNIKMLVHVLKCFFMASGLKINLQESKLIGIGIDKKDVDKAARLVGSSMFSTPLNYFGFKVGDVMSKVKSWDEVTYKLSARLTKWKLNTLSIGETSLIESTGRLGKWLGLDGTRFWLPKIMEASGCLVTLLLISSNRSIWLDIIRGISSLKNKGINLIAFVRRHVGNGEDTKFWEDTWLSDVVLKVTFPRIYALELEKNVNVANKKKDSTLMFSFLRSPIGGVEEEQYNLVQSCVINILLPQIRDRWVWSLVSSGEFSVKLLLSSSSRVIWHIKCGTKCSVGGTLNPHICTRTMTGSLGSEIQVHSNQMPMKYTFLLSNFEGCKVAELYDGDGERMIQTDVTGFTSKDSAIIVLNDGHVDLSSVKMDSIVAVVTIILRPTLREQLLFVIEYKDLLLNNRIHGHFETAQKKHFHPKVDPSQMIDINNMYFDVLMHADLQS
ncbi:hypothetical protein Tco_1176771 [Tanacetum coccineum]